MLRGVRKAQSMHLKRQSHAGSMLRWWLSQARPEDAAQMRRPPSGRLNYIRSRAPKKRKLAYDLQGHRTVDVSTPGQADMLPAPEPISRFTLPMLPDNTPVPLGQRRAGAAAVAPMAAQLYLEADEATEEENALTAGANGHLTEEDLTELDAAAEAAAGPTRGSADWTEARRLLSHRLEHSRPPAQGVPSRTTNKPHPTTRQTSNHGATGSRGYISADPVLTLAEQAEALRLA